MSHFIRAANPFTKLVQRFGAQGGALSRASGGAGPNGLAVGRQLKLQGRGDGFCPGCAPGAKFAQKFGPTTPGVQGMNPAAQRTAPGVQGTGTGGPETPASGNAQDALSRARGLIGTQYDNGWKTGAPNNPNQLHCAEFVNAVYKDLPPDAPSLTRMGTPGAEPKPGDVVCSSQPAPAGHVGIMTEKGTIIHSIPGKGVHESSRAEFESYSPIQSVISR
jgi:cell wall-associated NlpC family hydrolase